MKGEGEGSGELVIENESKREGYVPDEGKEEGGGRREGGMVRRGGRGSGG